MPNRSALALQFSFPEPGTAVVAAARITEDQELVLVRKAGACRVGPPLTDGMGGKFGRIIGVAQIGKALVMDDVIDAIRHGPTQRIAREIMQIDLLRRLNAKCAPWLAKLPISSLFLVSTLMTG